MYESIHLKLISYFEHYNVDTMTIRIICSKCKRVIYVYNDTYPVYFWEIIKSKYKMRCPYCGNKLKEKPVKVVVYAKKKKLFNKLYPHK